MCCGYLQPSSIRLGRTSADKTRKGSHSPESSIIPSCVFLDFFFCLLVGRGSEVFCLMKEENKEQFERVVLPQGCTSQSPWEVFEIYVARSDTSSSCTSEAWGGPSTQPFHRASQVPPGSRTSVPCVSSARSICLWEEKDTGSTHPSLKTGPVESFIVTTHFILLCWT